MSLVKDLPDHLYWLTEKVKETVKPGAFLMQERDRVAPVGGTFISGAPDIPRDADWATEARNEHWDQSPYDGPSFWLQLNLADIPAAVRKPQWPSQGVVWLVLDLSAGGCWKANVHFDPRPAQEIPWEARRATKTPPRAVSFVLQATLPCATDKTFPEISADWREGGLCSDFDNWVQDNYCCARPSDIQVGGWVWPCQGDLDYVNETVMMAFERQPFGDSGAVYLHYDSVRGFFAYAQTH
jgi:hypothetical protein